MALTKKIEYKYEILPNGNIHVREKSLILEDGVVIADTNHRRVIEPDTDVSNESDEIQALAAAVHTPARVQVVRDRKAAEKAQREAEKQAELEAERLKAAQAAAEAEAAVSTDTVVDVEVVL